MLAQKSAARLILSRSVYFNPIPPFRYRIKTNHFYNLARPFSVMAPSRTIRRMLNNPSLG